MSNFTADSARVLLDNTGSLGILGIIRGSAFKNSWEIAYGIMQMANQVFQQAKEHQFQDKKTNNVLAELIDAIAGKSRNGTTLEEDIRPANNIALAFAENRDTYLNELHLVEWSAEKLAAYKYCSDFSKDFSKSAKDIEKSPIRNIINRIEVGEFHQEFIQASICYLRNQEALDYLVKNNKAEMNKAGKFQVPTPKNFNRMKDERTPADFSIISGNVVAMLAIQKNGTEKSKQSLRDASALIKRSSTKPNTANYLFQENSTFENISFVTRILLDVLSNSNAEPPFNKETESLMASVASQMKKGQKYKDLYKEILEKNPNIIQGLDQEIALGKNTSNKYDTSMAQIFFDGIKNFVPETLTSFPKLLGEINKDIEKKNINGFNKAMDCIGGEYSRSDEEFIHFIQKVSDAGLPLKSLSNNLMGNMSQNAAKDDCMRKMVLMHQEGILNAHDLDVAGGSIHSNFRNEDAKETFLSTIRALDAGKSAHNILDELLSPRPSANFSVR